jgi:hypothetical protein
MKSRSLVALIVTVLLISATTAAYADHAYTAQARAVGLTLQVQGQTMTAALTDAKVQSGPVQGDGCKGDVNACATAAGLAGPLGNTARASAPGNQGTKTAPANKLTPTGNTVLGHVVAAQIGQSTAVALPPADTRAKGTAGRNIVSLNLGQQVAAVGQRIQSEVPDIVDGLAVVAQNDPSGATRRIADGLEVIAQNPAAPLVKITTGPAWSESTDLDGKTIATAIADGAEVVIGPAAPADAPLDRAAIGSATSEGFIVLRISRSMASATTDQKTGTADFSPPQVTVLSLADVGLEKVSVMPGQSNCFAANTPFETCVSVSSGAKRVDGAAAASSVGGVEISALRTRQKGAVSLRLGVVQAGVNAAERKVSAASPESTPGGTVKPSTSASKPSRILPKTGGMNLVVPGFMLLGASSLTLAVLRRRGVPGPSQHEWLGRVPWKRD